MKKILLLALTFILSANVHAQNCLKYYPTKKGMTLEYESYDKKDKLTATSQITVLGSSREDGFEIVKYKSDTKSPDSDTVIENIYEIKCKNDSITINLGDMLNQTIYEEQGLQVKVTGDQLVTPSNLTEGQELSDGQMNIELLSQGNTVMTLAVSITNRKVEKTGKIKTPAGTFDAVCISYDTETVVGFIKTKGHVEDWINEKYGNIKQETFDKKGKVQSSQILTKITE